MGAIASIIIPIAPWHVELAEQAIASAESQTVSCEVIPMLDTEGRGAGAMRNKGVERANAPFVIFVDADDVIERTFAERALHYYQRGYYVYTDYIVNGQIMRAPDCSPVSVWQTGAMHMVTCLIPTGFHYAAGGFDERLSGFEDTEYFVRMHTLGMCGLRCPEPLLHYRSRLGKRSQAFSKSGEYSKINQSLVDRYARHSTVSCGCGGGNAPQVNATNIPNPGDVLCECLYAPKRQVGRVTQKQYPRAGFGDRIWVDPKDAARAPEWWTVVSQPYDISPSVDEIMRMVSG